MGDMRQVRPDKSASRMNLRSSNISKRKRAELPPKPEFGFIGIMAGLFVGWLAGAGLEVSMGKPKMLVMALTMFAGLFVGMAVEAVRFWRGVRRYRAARKSPPV